MKLYLEFDAAQGPLHHARLEYAFRCFCAIYGHHPLLAPGEMSSADVRISYVDRSDANGKPVVHMSNLYRPRPVNVSAPAPGVFQIGSENMVLIHGCSGSGPDWLGEIFEWLSCADEYSISDRDSIGRIPFERSLVGRHGLDVCVPYAALAMMHLQRSLAQVVGDVSRFDHPLKGVGQFVVNTHDIDFFPLDRSECFVRAAKNSLTSLAIDKAPALACSQAVSALRVAITGRNSFMRIDELAAREAQRGISASYYFLVRHAHRRDGNYRIGDPKVLRSIRYLKSAGMEVGIHGSYLSLNHESGLSSEFETLRFHGLTPQGGRQHWLRFDVPRLITAVQKSDSLYDASLGWSDRIGFRAGACFAFPPYDFAAEKAAGFLEIPLVIMDSSLVRASDSSHAFAIVKRLFDISRRLTWGGFSVLWHPTSFGGAQLPPWVGDLFWLLVDHSLQASDKWLSAKEFLDVARERYVAVGLLPHELASPPNNSLQEVDA
jgi:hypothetical protein